MAVNIVHQSNFLIMCPISFLDLPSCLNTVIDININADLICLRCRCWRGWVGVHCKPNKMEILVRCRKWWLLEEINITSPKIYINDMVRTETLQVAQDIFESEN